MHLCEAMTFERLRDEELLGNFDKARLRLSAIDNEIDEIYKTINSKTAEAYDQKQRIYKALTRI